MAPLLNSSLLAGLERLALSGSRFTLDEARILADSPRLPRLARLALQTSGFGEAGIRSFTEAGWFAGLSELILDCYDHASHEVPALGLRGDAGQLARLERLCLARTRIDDEALLRLSLLRCPSLAEIRLGNSAGMTRAGLRTFFDAPGLPALRRLQVLGNISTELLVEALDGSALAERLTHLRLTGEKSIPAVPKPLLDPSRWPCLKRLALPYIASSNQRKPLRDAWGKAVTFGER